MKVSEVIATARSCELSNLSTSSFTDSRIIQFINLGIIELSKRFIISTKAEKIKTSMYTSMYTLRSSDVIGILDIYDKTGRALVSQVLSDDENYDYKLINNTTFLYKHKIDYKATEEVNPITGIEVLQYTQEPDNELMVIYSAVADLVLNTTDDLTIPLVFMDPLMAYIGYKASHSITQPQSGGGENVASLTKFEASCRLLENSVYVGQTNLMSKSIQSKGFK